MRLVPHAALRPHRCAVIPFKGNSSARGFVDTGMDLPGWDPHVYVSVEAVEAMARVIPGGWVPGHVVAGKNTRIAELEAKVARAETEVTALLEQLAAVQVLKNAGFAQTRPPGRPPRKVAA